MDKKLRTPIAATLLVIISLFSLYYILNPFTRYGVSFTLQSVFDILKLVIDLALCFTLFAKKRNNSLLVVLGGATLLNVAVLIGYFNIADILLYKFLNLAGYALVYAILLLFAIAFCEQTLIKADLSKIKRVFGKIFFLPAILYIVANARAWIYDGINMFYYFDYEGIYAFDKIGLEYFFRLISGLLGVIVLLSIAQWLKDPYSKTVKVSEVANNGTYVEREYDEAYCELGKHIVLCLFTFGIWYLIWIYRTTKYLNKAPNAEHYNPTNKLLLCMFIPFYQIYWFYKHGQRIDAMSKQKKLNNSDMTTLCLILGIFIPIVACILMQDRINTICTTKVTDTEPVTEKSTTDELKKYKELLDSDVITQEEFDAKKKQLLGL